MEVLETKRCNSRVIPAIASVLSLLCLSGLVNAKDPGIALEKSGEFYVRGFSTPPRYSMGRGFSGISTWTQIQHGYLLRTPSRLYFYSPSLTLTHSIRIGELGSLGATDLKIVDDSLIYVLDLGSVSQYDLEGNLLRRWLYPSSQLHGFSFAVLKNKILIAGIDWNREKSMYGYHRLFLYDTSTTVPPLIYEKLCPKSRLDLINREKFAGNALGVNVTIFRDGFVIVSGTDPEVFLFSSSGALEEVIDDIPVGYKGISEAPAIEPEKALDLSHWEDWFREWDYQGSYGIAILNDTLLIVPRHTTAPPYWIDIYNLKERSLISRLEVPAPLIGVSAGRLFFVDSATYNFAKITSYAILPIRDTLTVTDSATVAKILHPKEPESNICSGRSGCCSPTGAFEHVQCAPNKLHVVDAISAGLNRIGHVVCNYALAPDSLFQFCSSQKKNLFVFVSPLVGGSHKLLDTVYTCIKDKDDWYLITVVCYPAPPDLDFYLRDLKGDQILVNRCVSVPDSTLALSDLGLPPLVLALSEGGKEVLSGYSLEPYFDPKKVERGEGITFEEFLKRCGIIEQ